MNAGVWIDRRPLAVPATIVAALAVASLAVTALAVAGFAVAAPGAARGDAVAAATAVVLVGGVGERSRGIAGVVGWIVAGALLGGAVGYGAASVVQLPLSTTGVVGLGIALGGGLGGITHLLSTEDPASAGDERMTVDMASEDDAGPRPADLFEEHPDPVLYVTDTGGGPVVRAANAAYERAFDLPATAIEDAPLGDVLVAEDGTDRIVEPLADGEALDEVVAFETPEGSRRYRVRTVAAADDGYLLFTPVES